MDVIRHCSDVCTYVAIYYAVLLPKSIPSVCIHKNHLIVIHSFVDFLQVLTMGCCQLASAQCHLPIAKGS